MRINLERETRERSVCHLNIKLLLHADKFDAARWMSLAFCWFHSFMKIVFINAIEIVLFASKWINLHTAGQISSSFLPRIFIFSFFRSLFAREYHKKKSEKYKEKTQATDSGDVAVSDSFHYLSTRAFRVLFRTGSVWKVRGRSSTVTPQSLQ